MPHKPAGYTSVAPYLTVNGARRTIDHGEIERGRASREVG